MNLTINTAVLKDMVTKAVRGASNNKLLPITSMLGIESVDGILCLMTTDGTNYLAVRKDIKADEDFSVTVYADLFSKLITKMTCETVTIQLKDKYLEVTGNGTYKIELPFDENGQIVKFPKPAEGKVFELYTKISKSIIEVILNSVKPSLAVSLENPQYTNYWVGDEVIATDTYKIAGYNTYVFSKPALVSAQMMELLAVTDSDSFEVSCTEDDEVLFEADDCTIYGKFSAGLEDYAINEIKELLDFSFDSRCSINKYLILQVLDRLALFVRPFDDGSIRMTFTQDGIVITSLADSGSELVPYMTSNDYKEFSCSINVNTLLAQIKANICEEVVIEYGIDSSIKISDGMITKVVALNE